MWFVGHKSENWKRHRRYKLITQKRIAPLVRLAGDEGAAKRMENCGLIVNTLKCEECSAEYFAGFYSCGVRWCLNCAHKRILAWIVRLLPIFQEWLEDGNYISMLNFTVRDGEDLAERVAFLENSFRTMYNSDKKRRALWNERFPGGIRSLEVKIGENSGKWHPHLHCLVMQEGGSYVKDYEWSSQGWHHVVGFQKDEVRLLCDGSLVQIARHVRRADGSSDYDWNGNVYIKKISVREPMRKGQLGKRERNPLLNAICETLKYIVKIDTELFGEDLFHVTKKSKPTQCENKLFTELYWSLKGKKQTATWGKLHGIKDILIENDVEKGDMASMMDFVCQRCGCTEAQLVRMIYRVAEKKNLLDICRSRTKDKKITLLPERVILKDLGKNINTREL